MDRDAQAPARSPFGTPQTLPKAGSGTRHPTASAPVVKRKVNCHRIPDYRPDQVVGANVVRQSGGKVLLVDLLAGEGTTATIERARARASHRVAGQGLA
jgi:hypothetical protein